MISAEIVELIVIVGYFICILAIGFAFRKFNSDISDFFRSGARATWWLAGSSSFMAVISAYTFTGASGVAYEAGWSVAIIYVGTAIGFLINFIFLAPWFRQLRAITVPEVICRRFGVTTQQFYGTLFILMALITSALQLWAISIFISAIFGFHVYHIILIVGIVVTVYSSTGGSWAVMATDFVQSLVLVPITILLCVLAVIEIGGLGDFFGAIDESGLHGEFRIIKEPDEFPMGRFSLIWAIAIIIQQVISTNTMSAAQRYFGVKDGLEARKAALLSFTLMVVGSLFWFVPPMVSRLLYSDQVMGLQGNLSNPSESAFAIAALNLMPSGMTGIIVVSMLAATMSSMDSGINRNAGIFVRDIIPSICRTFGINIPGDPRQLVLARIFSLIFGLLIIGSAFYMASTGGTGLFDMVLRISAMLGVPLSVPLLLGLFFKKVPFWSAIFAVSMGFISSAFLSWGHIEFSLQSKIIINVFVTSIAFLVTRLFWKTSNSAYRDEVDNFFVVMKRPVDFEKEVGNGNDREQLKMIGTFTLGVGFCMLLLLLIPNSVFHRMGIFFVCLFMIFVGLLMIRYGYRSTK